MSRINVARSNRHDTIKVTYRLLRWHVFVNGHPIVKVWKRDEAVTLGNFLARLAAPSTLIISPGPGQSHGERTEF